MKKYIYVIFCLINFQFSNAQNSDRKLNKTLKPKYITRLIKTLSSDEMLGRSAFKPLEIEKATVFIENEFDKIGLQKFQKLDNYRQNINYQSITISSLKAFSSGKEIPNENLLLLSESENVILGNETPIKIIEKEKNFFAAFRAFSNDSTSKVVLVAPEHEKLFKRAQGFYGKPKMMPKAKIKSIGNTLFVLGNTAAQNIEAKATLTFADAAMNNVIGVLEGKSKKDEIVIFSGHYDHLGSIDMVNNDAIANGADDDASGTTAVIALAKYFKKLNNNERTLVFVAFTAEEIGGYGAKYFSENINPDKVMAMINIEMIGKESKWGKNSAFMTGFDKSNLGTLMQQNLVGTPFAINPDPYPDQGLFYRSDNATLARLGVPAHSFSTDQIDTDKLYHSVDDEFQSLDVSNIVATIKALAKATKSVVSGVDTPTRVDKTTIDR